MIYRRLSTLISISNLIMILNINIKVVILYIFITKVISKVSTQFIVRTIYRGWVYRDLHNLSCPIAQFIAYQAQFIVYQAQFIVN